MDIMQWVVEWWMYKVTSETENRDDYWYVLVRKSEDVGKPVGWLRR